MWNRIRALALLALAGSTPASAGPTDTREYSVQLSASVQSFPPRITLKWTQDNSATQAKFSISRKAPGESKWSLPQPLPEKITEYVDDSVAVGKAYEYQIIRHTQACDGYGYIYSGIEVPAAEHRGTLVLIVDQKCASPLANELAQLREDLVGDGWSVDRFDVSRSESVLKVKDLIRRQYTRQPEEVNCVFLFGHVPVPYSGNIAPDGHWPAHLGAWPCDGFYGDMDGDWTDVTVKETRATDPRNHNVPGDGKFDQSTFPAPLKLMVGRVDMADMPGRATTGGPTSFPSEVELLRNYLRKDHEFRMGRLTVPARGIIGDNFGGHDGEAFAASGWRNFSTFFGPDNVASLPGREPWISGLSKNPCSWAYICGPGTYESIDGLGAPQLHFPGTTYDLVRAGAQALFVMLYGSWSGDWDSEDNLQRSVLAMPDYGLACVWSGRPHWFLHHMALGEPIGFGVRLTQNNRINGLYRTQVNTAAGQIHVALMGDPTLRLSVVPPPSELMLTTSSSSRATLRWRGPTNEVSGYYVYRAENDTSKFLRLTPTPLTCNVYSDLTEPCESAWKYMVRTIQLQTSPSGTYLNLSQGAFISPPMSHATERLAGLSHPRSLGEPLAAAPTTSPR